MAENPGWRRLAHALRLELPPLRFAPPSPAADPLFASLFGAALLLDAGIWAYLVARYGVLPEVLPIHYNAAGDVDRVGFRGQLFILPIIGMLIALTNGALSAWLYRAEQKLCYILLSIGVFVQLLLWVAAARLIH